MMKRVVFDFDGTLLNSRERHVIVLKDCLRFFGIFDANLDEYMIYKADGNSTYAFLCNKLMLSEDLADKISKRWISMIELDSYLAKDSLYMDAIDTLQYCSSIAELYLLSARSNGEELYRQVERMGLRDYFCEVICVSPRHATTEKINVLRRIKPCVIVGDTEVEYQAAQEVGISCYLLNRGFRSKEYFEQRGIGSNANLSQLKYFVENVK